MIREIMQECRSKSNINGSKKKIDYYESLQIQIKLDQTEQLLNKPYVNEVTLTGQNPPLKYC